MANTGALFRDLRSAIPRRHRYDRLRGEVLQERDLAVGERPRLAAGKAERADWLSFTEQGHADDRTNKANA